MSYSQETCRLALSVGFEEKDLHNFGRLLEGLVVTAKVEERERICAAIKAEDDHCAAGDYMLDSDDCIKVARGTWERPDWGAV